MPAHTAKNRLVGVSFGIDSKSNTVVHQQHFIVCFYNISSIMFRTICHASRCSHQITSSRLHRFVSGVASRSPLAATVGSSSSSNQIIINTWPMNNIRRSYHASTLSIKDDIHVIIETTSNSTTSTITEQSTQSNKSTCSQDVPLETDDEEEMQEEMFVVADPILNHGTRQEWGGPRRGGRLKEPTRFGDWERKGRCSDF